MRFARKQNIDDVALCDSIRRAQSGQIDADLGGGVIKQRIARKNEGKSGGFRTIVLFKSRERSFFVFGFPKSGRASLTKVETDGFKSLANELLEYDDTELNRALKAGVFDEVKGNEHEK